MKQGFDNIFGSKTFKMLKDSVLNGGHPYVEIGGVKWSTMNVGATEVTDYGLYFQWGDTQGYTASQVGNGEGQKYFFGWEDYIYYNGGSYAKYNDEDGLQTLETYDDAVHTAWGGSWRMPTTSEFQALCAATTSAWTEDYQGSGVSGLVVTDKTDSSKVLFFPACGSAGYGSMYNVGYFGYYWSSSLDDGYSGRSCAYGLSFYHSRVDWDNYYDRCHGFSVRGVLDA